MGRTIKLLLYYFAYQLAFMGVFLCGYMIFHHTTELPQSTDSTYITLILLAQVLSTAAVGIHLIVGKYVPLDRKTWAYYNSGKVLIAAILLIVGMGLWSNYLNELADLPNNMQEIFAMMMQHPLGAIIPRSHPRTPAAQMEETTLGHRCIVTDIRYRTWQLGTSSFRFRGRSGLRLDLLSYR